MSDQSWPKSRRIRRTREYRRVQHGGRRFKSRHLVFVVLANGLDEPRFGHTVSRKVGNAVVRNQVKRWLREALRRTVGSFGFPRGEAGSVDVVVIARPSAATAGYATLVGEVEHGLTRLRELVASDFDGGSRSPLTGDPA